MQKIALHTLSWIVERWWPGLQLDPRPRASRHSSESPAAFGGRAFRWSSVDACQAARTELRNLPTSSLRRLESPDSDRAADRTWLDADPVSLAPRCTSVMLEETCWVPWAACCTLREISCVAAPCSSMAAAMVDDISDSFSMVALISLMALTDSCVAA